MTELVPLIFPWEALLLVFEHSDPSTLATLGTVSMDVLEATTPLLYRRVEMKSIGGLEKLFCGREKESETSRSSRINHLLTLSQIKTFHLNLLSSKPAYKSPKLSTDRITHSTPIPLDFLQLSTNFDGTHRLLRLHSQLLPHFDPIRVEYDTHGRPFDASPIYTLSGLPLLSNFHRLTTLEFRELLPVISDFSTSPSTHYLADLPAPSRTRRRTVRLHLATLLSSEAPDSTSLVRSVATKSAFNVELMQEGSMVLVVQTEEERKEAEEAVEQLEEATRIKFAVELEV